MLFRLWSLEKIVPELSIKLSVCPETIIMVNSTKLDSYNASFLSYVTAT